jgi:UDP-glucose 4-epimerase
MKKILITGGAGFIGSNLCEYIIGHQDAKVWSIDDYSTGSSSNHVDGVEYIEANTRDYHIIDKINPEIVYHLGEYSRVEQSFEDYDKVMHSNMTGTRKIVEFCKVKKAKLIYAGSSTKFGDQGASKNNSPYAWSKATNTEFINNYSKWFGLNYAIVYFYNAYGKNEIEDGKYATLVGKYKKSMREGKKLKIVLPGTQQRNFTHVSDIVLGITQVAANGNGDGFGIGSPTQFTIEELAALFGGETDYIAERKGNRLSADLVTQKTERLGWRPTVFLPDYIEHLRNNNWRD